MKEAQAKRAAEKKEMKDKIMTSGGPTQEPEDVEGMRKKFKDQQKLTKINLEKQRDMEE